MTLAAQDLVTTGFSASPGGVWSVTPPTNLVAGDLMLLITASAGPSGFATSPSRALWHTLAGTVETAGSFISAIGGAWKIADSTDVAVQRASGTLDFTMGTTQAIGGAAMMRIPGGTGVESFGSNDMSTATTFHVTDAVVASQANSLLVGAWNVADSGFFFWTPAVGMTELFDNHLGRTGFWANLEISHQAVGAGTYTKAASTSSNTGVNMLMAITSADTVAPVVTITSPADGALIASVTPIAAAAFDVGGVASVQWQIDGANYHAPDTVSPYSDTIDPSTLALGTHTLTAVATDAAGNVGSNSISFMVPAPSTPAFIRMVARQGSGIETIHPELKGGIIFTPRRAIAGSVAYGPQRYMLDLSEANADGAIITKDWHVAAALRSTGLFTEVQL